MNGSSLTTSTSRSQPVDARVVEKRGIHADYDDAVGERIDMPAGQGAHSLAFGFLHAIPYRRSVHVQPFEHACGYFIDGYPLFTGLRGPSMMTTGVL
jgi:hypothetical protein